MPEGERVARLSASPDGHIPPPAIARFLDDTGALEPRLLDEAVAFWWSIRRQLENTRREIDAEALQLMTLILANHFGATRDGLRHRAMLESALETLGRFPRFAQLIVADLGRNALACGDVAAAERWLARCDPRPDDLASDSTYRYGMAQLAIARGDGSAALQFAGGYPCCIQVAMQYATALSVARAHALETIGSLQAAEAELRRAARTSPTTTLRVLANITAYVPCPITVAAIRRGIPSRPISGAASVGAVLLLLVLSAAAIVAEQVDLGFPTHGLGYVLGALLGLVAFILIAVSVWLYARGRPQRQARARGRPALAVVRGIAQTGIAVRHPLFRVELDVTPPGAPTYAATLTAALDVEESVSLHRGAHIHVLSDPTDPEAVLLLGGG